MKIVKILLLFLPCVAFAQAGNATAKRHYTDTNASVNKTDIPRTLHANNATNATPGDWVDQSKPVKTPTAAASQTSKNGAQIAQAKVPVEASAVSNRPIVKDKQIEGKNIPGSKKQK